MNKSILISGYGSAGRRHANILSSIVKKKNIIILTNQKISDFRTVKTLKAIKEIDPSYIVLCNPTNDHLHKIKFIEKNFKDKVVLVEKPLFSKPNKIKIKNNKYYVGYNLRFNPIISFLKKKIKLKKVWNVNIFCGSYLPSWRSNINYSKSSSAKKNLGGGVLLDLSHEFDYVQWLFGKIEPEHCKSKKISNLNIQTDDFFHLVGKAKKALSVQITLNYFTRNPTRQIFIDGKNISIQADLIEKNIVCYDGNKKSVYNFRNFSNNYEYKRQHLAILKNQHKDTLCTYEQGMKIINLIKKMKDKAKKIL